MVSRLNVPFNDDEFEKLKEKKSQLMKKLNSKRMNWEQYILHITGIKKWKQKSRIDIIKQIWK